jgi:SAM-dependent methyltransferase
MIVTSKLLHKIVNLPPVKKLLTENRFLVRLYFNYLYTWNDPYRLGRDEEVRKFEKAFSLVREFRAANALEIGCGEGMLTHYVAAVSDKVFAFDISDAAVSRAKAAHKGRPGVEHHRADLLTDYFPEEAFDFIFCSEMLFYFLPSQLDAVVHKIARMLRCGGKLLTVHTRSLKDDTEGLALKEFGAKTIHDAFIGIGFLQVEEDIFEQNYRITLLRRSESPAVADYRRGS